VLEATDVGSPDQRWRSSPAAPGSRWPGAKASAPERPERQALGELEERLIAQFSPAVRPEDVRRCVAQVVAGYEDARVRTYLAILVERGARERLQAIVRHGSCSRQTVGQRGAS
jgi:hypothetical protein